MAKPSTKNRPDPPDRESLAVRAQGGDDAARDELVDSCRPYLFAIAHKMLKQDAEDAVQETCLKILSKLDQYDHLRGSFTTWIGRILTTTCIDTHDRNRRHSPLDHDLSGPTREASEGIIAVEVATVVQECLDRLSERHRDVLQMFEYEKMACDQIGETLQITTSAVYGARDRAKRKLRLCLESKGVNSGDDTCLTSSTN